MLESNIRIKAALDRVNRLGVSLAQLLNSAY